MYSIASTGVHLKARYWCASWRWEGMACLCVVVQCLQKHMPSVMRYGQARKESAMCACSLGPQVTELLNKYMERFRVTQIFDEADVAHW